MAPRLETSKLKFGQLKEKKLRRRLGMQEVKKDYDIRAVNGGGEFGFTLRDDADNQFRLKGRYDRKKNVQHLSLGRVSGPDFVLPVMGPNKLSSEIKRRLDIMRRESFKNQFENRMANYFE